MPPTDSFADHTRATAEALPARALSVEALADALGVDRSTLYRTLQAEGATPAGLVADVRFGRALRRLKNGGTVAEAGVAAGYAEVASFSRAFRRRYGVPPSAWAGGGGLVAEGGGVSHQTDNGKAARGG